MSGGCRACTQPAWCDDPAPFGFNGTVRTARDWVDRFAGKDGEGVKQCKYKSSQRQTFIETMRLHYRGYQQGLYPQVEGGWTNLWNEVTVHDGPNDHAAQHALNRNVLGFYLLRGIFNHQDRDTVTRLRDHYRDVLGLDLPIYVLSSEPHNQVASWHVDQPVNLEAAPYSLETL